uniref:Nucleoprotein n=1 Tax=Issyk-Kul virus TaxID=1453408 RepID=A0A0M4KS98_9VIRU|nr:nucleoprotein [Issyk-Kul virus]
MSQLNFETVEGLNEWFNAFSAGKGLDIRQTNSACFGYEPPDYTNYAIRVGEARDDKEKNAVYGQAVIAATRFVAPLKECAWVSCKGMVERSLKWFDIAAQNDVDFKIWHENYNALKSRVPSLLEVAGYRTSVLNWRVATRFEDLETVKSLFGEMEMDYAISPDIAPTIVEMLNDMKDKRERAFGVNGGGRGKVSQEHVGWMKLWLDGQINPLSIPQWGSWDKTNNSGKRLGATGIVNLYNPQTYDAFELAERKYMEAVNFARTAARDLDPATSTATLQKIRACIDEAKEIANAREEGTATYTQQMAAMDVAFSSHYWLWRSGCKYESFAPLSQFLFELGQRPVGSAKVDKMLGEMPWMWARGLRSSFADKAFHDKVHMHPGVLTQGRLLDMASCFGAIPANNPERAREGTGNPRFILNLRRSGRNLCGTVAAKLFEVFKAGFDVRESEIIPAEHMLHQSFLGKRSHLQYAGMLEGDFTKIHIVNA